MRTGRFVTYVLGILIALPLVGAGCAAPAPVAPPSPEAAAGRPDVSAPAAKLDLHGRGLTKVPADVFTRTGLEELDLSDNAIADSLPSELGRLTRLKVLDVSGNKMTGLPAEVGRLKDLEVLDVSGNRLTGLPLEIGDLPKLQLLDVHGNPFSEKDLNDIVSRLPKTAEVRR